MRNTLVLMAAFAVAASLRADVTPAPLFTHNAVLQRDKAIPVWGKASPGENVSVTFAGHSAKTTAGADGKWRVDLPAQPANSAPSELVIAGNNTITLTNIVVGEVWIASGQSNMEWSMANTYDRVVDVPASARFPLIRHIKIKRVVADTPQDSVEIMRNTWEVAGPTTTTGFSAAGYYFAKDIHELTGVPVGIIGANWGGTLIEPWISPEGLDASSVGEVVRRRWAKQVENYPTDLAKWEKAHAEWTAARDAAKSAGTAFNTTEPKKPAHPSVNHQRPSALSHSMINPLVPYALRGAIWYQGESNVWAPKDYQVLFPALIADWRARFGQGDFPFYWVQLSNYKDPQRTDWAFLREAQTKTLSVPNTGQAVSIDIGDVRDIHPRNKKDVGRRLARLALNRTYGIAMPDSGPVFNKAEREGAGFRVSFTELHGGLVAPFIDVVGFELAGEDKTFKPAKAVLDGDTVVVTSDEIAEPVAVRYAWRNATPAGLFNKQGLPAVPFRSDDW